MDRFYPVIVFTTPISLSEWNTIRIEKRYCAPFKRTDRLQQMGIDFSECE